MPTDLFGGAAAYPGNLLLFAQNLMEKGVVSATQESGAGPATRLYDRDRGPQWKGVTNQTIDIQVDLELYPRAFSHVGLVNVGINTGIEIYSGSNPTGTLRFSAASIMGGDPYLVSLGGTFNDRYLRLRILSGGVIPALGEMFVGTPQIISVPPALASPKANVGNVQRDRARGGNTWSVKLGPDRDRFEYSWNGLGGADLALLEAAWAECDQGAKNLIVRDSLGVARWMNWQSDRLASIPVSGPLASDLYEVPELVLEEVP